MDSGSYLARRNAFFSQKKNSDVTADSSELDQRQVGESEVDSSIDIVSKLDDEKVNDAQLIVKP